MFSIVCFTWDRLQDKERGIAGDLITAIFILSIPFVHLRGSVVSVFLYAIFLWQMHEQGLTKRAVGMLALAVAALALLVSLNVYIYGAIAGPVNTARPPTPAEWFSVLSMQLFNVRHGLAAYAPVWLVGYAGLWMRGTSKSRIGTQALILAIIAALTGIGINPGECWPARFWVLSIPMLTVGFCIFWHNGKGKLLQSISIALIALTLINTVIFIKKPNDFLENRQSTTTYQEFFNKFGHVNVGLALPVEVDDSVNLDAARNLTVGAGIFILMMVLAARRNKLFSIPAALIILAAIDLSRVNIVSPLAYTLTQDKYNINIKTTHPFRSGYVQIGNRYETWFTPPDWQRFNVTFGSGKETLSANQVIPFACSKPFDSIAIESSGAFSVGEQSNKYFALYQSDSIVKRWWNDLFSTC
ncbi:MAG: hypothetical protein NVSMB28_30850 [Collimonas sp.]